MYVYVSIGGICGISASGKDLGKLLWKNAEFAPAVVAPSPVVMDNGLILVTAGYGAGTALIKITYSSSGFTAKMIDQFKPSDGIASEQQTPVYLNGYLYAILPKDAGELRNRFTVYKPGNCRKAVVTSGKSERFGLGPYIVADGKFFILNDAGDMTIARVSPTGFKILDQARIIEGQDSWGPIAITGGYLLMRDSKQMVCLDIKAK
jgi:outer membrane protein assembly factor BamB